MEALFDLPQLRKALTATAPHILKSKETNDLSHLRLTLTAGQAWAQATNGVTVALASIDTEGEQGLSGDPHEDSFELSPSVVATVLSAFQASNADTDEMSQQLHVRTFTDDGGDWVELADISGLFPGQTLKVPAAPRPAQFPNLFRAVAGRIQARPLTTLEPSAGPLGKTRLADIIGLVKLFGPAETAYKHKVLFQATQGHRAVAVTCGAHFSGALLPYQTSDDPAAWHANHNDEQERLVEELGPLAMALADSGAHRDSRAAS